MEYGYCVWSMGTVYGVEVLCMEYGYCVWSMGTVYGVWVLCMEYGVWKRCGIRARLVRVSCLYY